MSTGLFKNVIEESKKLLDLLELEDVSLTGGKHLPNQKFDDLLISYYDLVLDLEKLNTTDVDKDYIECLRNFQNGIGAFQKNLSSLLGDINKLTVKKESQEDKTKLIKTLGAAERHKGKLNEFTKKTNEIVSLLDLPTRQEELSKRIDSLERSLRETHKSTTKEPVYIIKKEKIKSDLPRLGDKATNEVTKLEKEKIRHEITAIATLVLSFLVPIMIFVSLSMLSKAEDKQKEIQKYKDQLNDIYWIKHGDKTIEETSKKLKETVGSLSEDFLGYNIEGKVAKQSKPS